MTSIPVKISAKSARLMFTPCGPECIEAGCNGDCCDAKGHPNGCLVTVLGEEAAPLEARGATVDGGWLLPKPGERGCPFKHNGLCDLHDTPDKPFGCIVSPFTFNDKWTLIIRNRYKLLPCYKGPGPKLPAYKAFSTSLVAIFGVQQAQEIIKHLDDGGGDYHAFLGCREAAKLIVGHRLRHPDT